MKNSFLKQSGKSNFVMYLLVALIILGGCKKESTKDDTTTTTTTTTNSNTVLKEGTLTVTINGDGLTNKTITYIGQIGTNGTVWAVIYVKDTIHGLGPDKDYSTADLYYMPPKYSATNYDSAGSANGMVAIRFSGNKTITNDPWSYTDLLTYRGIVEFSFKKNKTDADAAMYLIEDGITVGSTTVTEYDTRVKGTFTATKMKKMDFLSTTPIYVDISGTFDLSVY